MRDRLLILTSVASLFCVTASAAEWFVSPDGTDADGRGAEAEPFHTINYAVGKANAGDTIVLLPGDYGADQGTTNTTVSGNSSANRVVIDKPLTVIGRDGRDKTRIVGAWDTTEYADMPYGFGPGAVRCVSILDSGAGTRLEGITFADGSVPAWSGVDANYGGGVMVNDRSSAVAVEIVDCSFIDCQAFGGGGILSLKASADVQVVRTLFKRCRASKFGHAMRGGAAYHCVFDDNGYTCFKDGAAKIETAAYGAGSFSYGKYAVNCTFLNGRSYGTGGNGMFTGVYNCLFQNNQNTAGWNTSYCKTVVNCIKGGNLNDKPEVVSPYDGDYRLTCDATAIDAGSADWLSLIPEEFRDKDFYGNPLTTDGKVSAGAVQEAATAAASGVSMAATTEGTWELDGEAAPICYRTWAAREGWPAPIHVKFVPADGLALVHYSFGEAVVWPLRDDSVWMTTSRAGQCQDGTPTTTANIFYADPVNGSDETGDGSAATPYRTLNKAVKKTTASFVVRALPGDYKEGGENVGDNITTRVVVPKTLAGALRVIAVEGPENTFISGASDSATDNGTGADAVRCIAVVSTNAYRAAFQGFTLRDGRTGPNSTVRSMGAALHNSDMNDANYASFNTAYLLDCVVTNCSGNRAGCIAGGNAYRCKFYDCKTFNGGGQCDLRYCNIVSSLFVGCGGKSQVFGNTAKGYNCTIYGSVGDVPQSVYNNDSGVKGYLYNCVSGRPSGTDISENVTDDQLVYTLYCRMGTNPNTLTTAVKEEPLLLVDADGGDYRLADGSAGRYLASTDYMQSCMDIDGNPFLFDTAAGRYQAGCYALRIGGTLYVDATNGSDANDGASESAAFKTLAAAMAAADYGDTVVALPGTYDEGTMVPTLSQSGYTTAPTLPARVVVKKGVTLESRDGAATTVIKGAASTSSGRSDGCGDGAVRGVFLCEGATLRGFTVTGGRTLYLTSASIDVMGGGVCGAYSATDGDASQYRGLVDNCIITGCSARTGGGAQYGTYRNCRFFGNSVYNNMGYALCRGLAEGCVFKGNGPGNGHSVCYNCKVVNCTLFGGQAGASSSNRGLVFNEGSTDLAKGLTILNSIVLGNYQARAVTNCYFLTGAVNTLTVNLSGTAPKESGIVTGSASVIDADGVPVADAAVIDVGDASFCSAEYLAGRDLAGTRRVLKSAVDIGAYEYDWGVPWAKTLGRRITITDMPSNAALSGERLTFADGTVSMTWEKGQINAPYIYNVRVTGSGTLTVTVNGEVVGMYTAANGAQELRFTSDLVANALQFVYVSGDGDTGGAELYGFSHTSGLIILLR